MAEVYVNVQMNAIEMIYKIYNAMMIRKQSPDTLRFLFGSLAG